MAFVDVDGERTCEPTKQPTKELARRLLLQAEANVAAGHAGIEHTGDAPKAGKLFDDWAKSLGNRDAHNDRLRITKHLQPMFGGMLVKSITLPVVMKWLDAMRAGAARVAESAKPASTRGPQPHYPGKPGPKPKPRAVKASKPARPLGGASQRHNLNTLSRFFSWAIERGHATINPVRMIPQGKRPTQAAKHDEPYLDDDAKVRDLVRALAHPVSLMFYLANRSGLRMGEVAGLRVSDFDFVGEGVLRVRSSYDGPLKEDKTGAGKVKWVPCPDDVDEVFGTHLAERRAEGAGPEDFAFRCTTREQGFYRKEHIEKCFERASATCGVKLTWYQCTRHAFVSRNMARGASLDEISAAVGHSSPVVTRRYYDHFVRRSFSPSLRSGLGIGADAGGIVVAMKKR
jgi:integrase